MGTPDYIPPEVISHQCNDNYTIDWWSFGCIVYEFLVSFPPFNDETIEKIFDNVLKGKIEFPDIGKKQLFIS